MFCVLMRVYRSIKFYCNFSISGLLGLLGATLAISVPLSFVCLKISDALLDKGDFRKTARS